MAKHLDNNLYSEQLLFKQNKVSFKTKLFIIIIIIIIIIEYIFFCLVFWTEQDSFPVSLPVISNNNNLEKPFLKVNEKSLERSEKSLNYSICSEKFCLGLSSDSNDNCVEKKTCEVLISGKFLDKKKGLTQFEINALVNANTNTKKWFSMGLSEDKKMGSDLVKDCLLLSDGTVKQTLSFNSENEKENELIDNNNYLNDIKEDETNYFDGILTCKWTLNAKILIKGKQFDLLLNKYFILLAFGDLEDDHVINEFIH
jgi:hypothetical protein